MGIFNEFNKKEKPVFTGSRFGFGSGGGGGGAAAGLTVTGGTEIKSVGYTNHVFTGPGTLTVANGDATVDYLVVGGGGAGG